MRGVVVFLGLLLMLSGGALAAVQFAPVDLGAIGVLDQIQGAREFLMTPNALYAGAGAAVFGLLLVVLALARPRKAPREVRVVKPPSMAPHKPVRQSAPAASKPAPSKAPPASPASPASGLAPPTVAPPLLRKPQAPPLAPRQAPPRAHAETATIPLHAKTAAAETAQPATARVVATPEPAPGPASPEAPPIPAPQAGGAGPLHQASAMPTPDAPAQPESVAPLQAAKPVASGVPPVGADPAAARTILAPDPRLVNRKRIQDLVIVNDALKAYHAKNGSYPVADGLAGANERGAGWIPGLAPDFIGELPRDPFHAETTQYVYVSDGANYKLLAQGVSLIGSGNVEVLGIRIDQTRNPTPQSAAFGFWTLPYAGA